MKEIWKNRFNLRENDKQINDRRNRMLESMERSEMGDNTINPDRKYDFDDSILFQGII